MIEETVLKFEDDFIAEYPEFGNLEVRVPPDSLYADDGTRGGMIGIAPVAADRLPGPLSEGLELRDVVSIQTDGATNFDAPVPICFPNYQNLEPCRIVFTLAHSSALPLETLSPYKIVLTLELSLVPPPARWLRCIIV